jgi:hypothetical protein
MSRTIVPIGGWCGPALILGKLGLRHEAYPFDFSRVTLDGVAHFARHGFADGFFPPGPPPFRPECVGIWVLFRGQHTAFAHFDLNDAKVRAQFERKIARWDGVLDGAEPVVFFRTVAARDPAEELALLGDFEAALAERNPRLDYRVVVSVHDQGLAATQRLPPLSPRVMVWGLEYNEDASRTLFDRSSDGYAEIVAHALDDASWPAAMPAADPVFSPERLADIGGRAPTCGEMGTRAGVIANFPWRQHNNIALIDGVASVGGTCTGVNSTGATAASVDAATGATLSTTCAACGNADMHKAGRPARTDRPFTDDEDDVLLVHLYKILMGGDKVEAVEQLAHEMDRGAFEVICRIQFLTNSSTKIAEGLDMDDSA